jgi:hypothetical protein
MDIETDTAPDQTDAPDAPAEETSLHDDIAAAMEEHAAESDQTPDAETEAQREARLRDEKGRFAKADREGTDKAQREARERAEAKPQEQAQEKPQATEKPQEKPAEQKPADRAPQSWKALAREEWSKLSPTLRDEITRREAEVTKVLNETAQARQMTQRLREAVGPYEQMLRADGADPFVAISSLFRAAHTLRTGSPQMKARLIANTIREFMPNRAEWEMLDRELAGIGAPPDQRQPTQQDFRDPRLDPLLERLQQAEQREAQASQQRIASMIEDISKEEFWEDVKMDVADILDLSARRGLTVSVRDAYTRAVALHPEVSKVMAQREAARRANPTGSTRTARAAASSVRSTPTTAVKRGGDAASLRDDIVEAFNESQNR